MLLGTPRGESREPRGPRGIQLTLGDPEEPLGEDLEDPGEDLGGTRAPS